MNVLHLASSDSGGACGAAMRIHGCLRDHASAVESKALVIWKNRVGDEEVYSLRDSFTGYKRYQLTLIDQINNLIINKIATSKANKASILFQNYRSLYRVENHKLVAEWADIIHLHYTYNMLNFPTFFNKVKKPIVWTFHDMAPFTGGNCYEHGNIEKHLDKYNHYLDYKKKFLKIGHVYGHATSQAFKDKAVNEYHTFTVTNCSVVDYPLDTNVFHTQDKAQSRKKYKLPENKKILLFVCADLKNARKGFYLLNECLGKITENNIHLAVVGGNTDSIPDNEYIHKLGFIRNPADLAELYSSVDLFVTPAIEEAFGQTTTESLCCGTPVVAFNTAGAQAQVEQGVNGWICNEVTSSALYGAIVSALEKLWDRDKIANAAQTRFSAVNVSKKYQSMYEQMLKSE